jgi:hypothetical protein
MHNILAFEADRRMMNITINSFDTELTKEQRAKLYPAIGRLFPACNDALAKADDIDQIRQFPNLRVVEVSRAMPWPYDAFKAFLARLNCPLETLIFAGNTLTDEQRAEYVSQIPSVKVVADQNLPVWYYLL